MTAILKVDTIQDTSGNNIINESSDTITIGASGDTINIPSGATITNSGTATGFGGGKVLQVVSATTTSATSTTSTSFVDTALSVAITPSASNSKVLIIAHGGGSATSGNESYLTLIRGSTNLGNATYGMLNWGSSSAAMAEATGLTYLDSPSTTSATTYKLQFKVGGGGTGYFNLNSQVASIVALEIGA